MMSTIKRNKSSNGNTKDSTTQASSSLVVNLVQESRQIKQDHRPNILGNTNLSYTDKERDKMTEIDYNDSVKSNLNKSPLRFNNYDLSLNNKSG